MRSRRYLPPPTQEAADLSGGSRELQTTPCTRGAMTQETPDHDCQNQHQHQRQQQQQRVGEVAPTIIMTAAAASVVASTTGTQGFPTRAVDVYLRDVLKTTARFTPSPRKNVLRGGDNKEWRNGVVGEKGALSSASGGVRGVAGLRGGAARELPDYLAAVSREGGGGNPDGVVLGGRNKGVSE